MWSKQRRSYEVLFLIGRVKEEITKDFLSYEDTGRIAPFSASPLGQKQTGGIQHSTSGVIFGA
jgi:hypothetical protein